MEKILGVLLLICSVSLWAGEGRGKINGVIPYAKSGGEKLFFVSVEDTQDPLSCNTTRRFVISSTNHVFDTTVSALLAAKVEQTIHFF